MGQVQLSFRILSRSRRCAIIGIEYRVEVAYRQGRPREAMGQRLGQRGERRFESVDEV